MAIIDSGKYLPLSWIAHETNRTKAAIHQQVLDNWLDAYRFAAGHPLYVPAPKARAHVRWLRKNFEGEGVRVRRKSKRKKKGRPCADTPA